MLFQRAGVAAEGWGLHQLGLPRRFDKGGLTLCRLLATLGRYARVGANDSSLSDIFLTKQMKEKTLSFRQTKEIDPNRSFSEG